MKISFAGYSLFSSKRRAEKEAIMLWDYILIVGLCFAPMTGLRTGRVGPGELLCLVWCLKHFVNFRMRISDTFKFFLEFILALLAGSAIGYFVARTQLRTSGFATWMYLGVVSIGFYQGISQNSAKYNDRLLFAIAVCTVLWQIFLYEYSLNVSRRFFGAPLWYAGRRYSGGGTNPHQVALLFCGMIFVFLRQILMRRHVVISLALSAASLYLMIKTESSTGIMAIALGLLITVYMMIGNMGRHKAALFALVTIVLLALVAVFYSRLMGYLNAWISEDKNGEGRLRIYSSIGEAFRLSPIFGLGPGVHGRGGRIEFHNTYLEIIAATGLVGTMVFIVYTVRILKRILAADWRLIPIIVTIYAYGFAGFAMRRLIYWGICMVTLALADTIARERDDPLLASIEYDKLI